MELSLPMILVGLFLVGLVWFIWRGFAGHGQASGESSNTLDTATDLLSDALDRSDD